MSNPQAVLVTSIATSVKYRYIYVAGYTWVLYDWLITLGQEIDLVWRRRPGAWKSKMLYAFIRYYGLWFNTFNVIVMTRSNWSEEFCHVYFQLMGVLGPAQMFALQGALLLRLSVMYERSFAVMATSTILFAIEFVSMTALYYVDGRHFVVLPIPAPATGCVSFSQRPAFAKIYWFIALSFETYLCILALWSAYSHRKASGMRSSNILTISIRDSLLWYVCLSACLFLNALGSMTGTVKLILVGIPAMQCTSTIGGSRFLLNLRAAYFASTRNMTSPLQGSRSGGTNFTQTEGTVGNFRSFASILKDEGEEVGRDCGGSTEMGLWGNETHHDDRSSSPPAIMLRTVPANRRRQRICSTQGSSSSRLREPGDGEGLGVSALDLSHPVHSSTRLRGQEHEVSGLDVS